MSRALKRSCVVLLCVASAACASRQTEYAPEDRVGSRSDFSIEYRGPLGQVGKASMVALTDKDVTINGKRYHEEVITYSGLPGVDDEIVYERWDADGIHCIDGSDESKTEYLDTAFPLATGKSWHSNNSDQTQYEVVGTETVDTPNNTFQDCLKIKFKRAKNEGTEYLAPNIGWVKTVGTFNRAPMTYVLTAYKH